MQNAGLDESQAGTKSAGRNINNLRYADETTLMAESKEELRTSPVAPMVKNLPAMWETWVQSLGCEDPLEEGMATHSTILTWRIPMDRGAWWATVHRVAKNQKRLSN